MQLRLLLTEECNRTCKGCCNKEYDLAALPICTSFKGYEAIMITGGEPLIKPGLLIETIQRIRRETPCTPIYVYTAYREDPLWLLAVLAMVDGITLTLHTRKDVPHFQIFNNILLQSGWLAGKSLRLNVFRGIDIDDIDVSCWNVKSDMMWIKDCPVPENEVFMRLGE